MCQGAEKSESERSEAIITAMQVAYRWALQNSTETVFQPFKGGMVRVEIGGPHHFKSLAVFLEPGSGTKMSSKKRNIL
jgi:hypothetical protein